MRRRLVLGTALVAVVGLSGLPSQAAPRSKPKPIKSTYTVNLTPDPTANVFTAAGQAKLCGVGVPGSQHRQAFKVPAAGTVKLVLDAEDPRPGTPYVFDWDMYLLDTRDNALGEGTSSEAHEEIVTTFKKAQSVVFLTCNLNGQPKGTISYTFTYT